VILIISTSNTQNKTGNAKWRLVHVSIDAVEKQRVLHDVSVCMCSLSYSASNMHAPCFHLWPAKLYNIFPHYLIKNMVFEKKNIEHTMCVLIFSTTFIWNISHSKKKWARYDLKCVLVFMQSSLRSFPILRKLNYSLRFSKNPRISNFMKILPVGAELFHMDGRTDTQTYDEANSRFSQFCESS
jgi:hypothetical protein